MPLLLADATAAVASVAPGENIIVNGRFEADQVEVPLYWETPTELCAGKEVFYDQSGGPRKMPCVRLVNHSPEPKNALLRQHRLRLVPGASYRLSAWIKTKDFHGRGGPIVINASWKEAVGISGFASDAAWKRYEKTFAMMPSYDLNAYSVAFHIASFTGEIDIADLRLEAVDAAAQLGSERPEFEKSENVPRFFPWFPRLGRIDAQTREVAFFFTGKLPAGDSPGDYIATLTIPSGKVSHPLREGVNDFVLPAGCEGGRLFHEVRKCGADQPLVSGSFLFKMRPKPEVDVSGHRTINNFVTEVLRVAASDGLTQDFYTTRDGWVFVRAKTQGAFTLSVDGEKIMDDLSPHREVFRYIETGRHQLEMKGEAQGVVAVRQIAEILDDPPCRDSYVTSNPSYGWDFFSRHVWPHATTFARGGIPNERLAEFKAKGSIWLENVNACRAKAETLSDMIRTNVGMTSPAYDGVTIDEQYFGVTDSIEKFVCGMRRFHAESDDASRRVAAYLVGKPLMPGSDREAFALTANASLGRGMAISEIYCRTRPTEADARAYIDDYIAETVRQVKGSRSGVEYYPNALDHFMILLANFSQIPTLSVWHHTEIDFKYFLDMQFHEIANNPLYRGLGGIGVWSSYYSDEEIHRWTFMLMRHYCIQGRKDMLSRQYGLTYLPGIVANGDFRESLDGWKTEGNVRRDSIAKFSDRVENRWGGNVSTGDSFAVLTKERGRTARLSQKLRNLTRGKMYSIDVICFDAQDAHAKTHRPDRFPLNVRLGESAERDEAHSWVFVDRRPAGNDPDRNVRVNRHHVVFTAHSETVPLSLDNADAKDGLEIGVNGIGAWPYVPANIKTQGGR